MRSRVFWELLASTLVFCLIGHSSENDTLESVPLVVKTDRTQKLLANPRLESSALEPSIASIEADMMREQDTRVLTEALQFLPGSWTETRGRKVRQFVSFRGQKYPYPDYSIDGAWQREFHELPYLISTRDMAEVQVIRSSATLINSLTGLAGVINFIPKRSDSLEFDLSAKAGNFGSSEMYGGVGHRFGSHDFRLSGSFVNEDGPEDARAKWQNTNVGGRWNWDLDDKTTIMAHGFYVHSYRELELASPPAGKRLQTDLGQFDPIDAISTNLLIRRQHSKNSSTELLTNFIYRYQNYQNLNDGQGGHQDNEDIDYEFTTQILQANKLGENNLLRYGLLYNRWLSPNGKRFYENIRQDVHTFSAVAVDEQNLGNFRLDGGVRINLPYLADYGVFDAEVRSVSNATPRHDTWDPIQPNAGVGVSYYFPKHLSLHINGNLGVAPARAGSKTENNTEPLDEKRYKGDAGLILRELLFGDLSTVGFISYQQDGLVFTGGLDTLTSGQILELYGNRDQVQTGVELEYKTRKFFGGFNAFVNFLGMVALTDSQGEWVKDKEKPQFVASLGGAYIKLPFDAGMWLKYLSEYESSRFAGDKQMHPLGNFALLNATAGYTVGKSKRLRIYVAGQNLMDENYSTVVGYPDWGRRYHVGADVHF